MQFVNRTTEQQRMKSRIQSNISAFIVIYGRRRCGKSRLIRETLTSDDIYFMADQTEAIQQRTLFSTVVSRLIPGFDKVKYPDWETLFEMLNMRLERHITVCLDEFPYLVKSAPELPSVLQKIMEQKERLKYHLIICGSSQQLMHGLVLDSSSPLFGRADEIMKLRSVPAPYLQDILQCTAIEAVEEYSVWGGIPRYWELRLTKPDLFEAIKYHLLTSQGVLYDEPLRLFLDDMRDTVQSFTILSLIASGCHRLSEIAARLSKPSTHLSVPLDKLLKLGYIERELPFGENHKNIKKSLYKIADPFLNFYFKYIVPYRSFIETEQPDTVAERIKSHFSEYVSIHWEKLCRQAITHLTIDGITFNPAMRWWGNAGKQPGIELDIVADSTDGRYLLVGECKWSEKNFTPKELLSAIEQKVTSLPFAVGKTVIPALFLKQNKDTTPDKQVFFPHDVLSFLR